MKKLTVQVKGRRILNNCIEINSPYTDSIVKGNVYVDHTTTNLIAKNNCDEEFVIEAQTLFTQVDSNGSTFKATILPVIIPPHETVNIPVYYNGVYNGVTTTPVYSFILAGDSIVYNLSVTSGDTLGVVTDFSINLLNREDYVFKVSDFTDHYSDADGDTITSVAFVNNVSRLLYNNLPYTNGAIIPLADIGLGKLKVIALNVDQSTTAALDYKVRDGKDKILGARITVNNSPKIISDIPLPPVPTLYTSNVMHDMETGTTVYKLHVEHAYFSGFMHTETINETVNTRKKVVTFEIDNGTVYLKRLDIPGGTASSSIIRATEPVTLPVGIYDCSSIITSFEVDESDDVGASAFIRFTTGENPDQNILFNVPVYYFKLGNGGNVLPIEP